MNATREYSESFHVRLSPDPPILLKTSTAVGDRLEVSPDFEEAGVYRRVSQSFIQTIKAEAAKHSSTDIAKFNRLVDIAIMAQASPVIAENDLGNPITPDVSWACKSFGGSIECPDKNYRIG